MFLQGGQKVSSNYFNHPVKYFLKIPNLFYSWHYQKIYHCKNRFGFFVCFCFCCTYFFFFLFFFFFDLMWKTKFRLSNRLTVIIGGSNQSKNHFVKSSCSLMCILCTSAIATTNSWISFYMTCFKIITKITYFKT